jgi:hypothetical protein
MADGDRTEFQLTRDELGACQNALNEVLHGPEATEEWEFQARMGIDRDAAIFA